MHRVHTQSESAQLPPSKAPEHLSLYKPIPRSYTLYTYYRICTTTHEPCACHLLLSGETYWKQFWKDNIGKGATTRNLQSATHSSKITFTPPVAKPTIWAVNSVSGGMTSTGMTVTHRIIVFWKISENPLEESKRTPVHVASVEEEKHPWAANPQMHFSLTGVTL